MTEQLAADVADRQDPAAPAPAPDPAAVRALVTDMRRLVLGYKFGIDEVTTKIGILRDEFRHIHDYNQIGRAHV